jgi:hypothetical protein
LTIESFTVLVIKATKTEGKLPNAWAQHHHSLKRASCAEQATKASSKPDYLVAKFKYNAENNSYLSPRKTLKPQEDGTKKSV